MLELRILANQILFFLHINQQFYTILICVNNEDEDPNFGGLIMEEDVQLISSKF